MLAILETASAVMDHRFIGLLVWVGIVVCAALEVKWATVTGAALMAVKQYCSGNWERKKPNETNDPVDGGARP